MATPAAVPVLNPPLLLLFDDAGEVTITAGFKAPAPVDVAS